MKKIQYFLLLMALYSYESVATIGINSMVEFAQEGEAQFTISNGEAYRQFISVAISSIKIENGEIVREHYTRDNIDTWSLIANPARTVIDAKLSKDFKLTYQPLPSASENLDKVYQVSFIPTPYFTEGEPVKQRVQVAVGFAPFVIVPAENDQPLDYEVTYNENNIQLNNHGDTYIRAFLDACPTSAKGKAREACSKVVYAVSGRHLVVPLTPEMLDTPDIKMDLSTHNLTYKDKLILQKQQTLRSKE